MATTAATLDGTFYTWVTNDSTASTETITSISSTDTAWATWSGSYYIIDDQIDNFRTVDECERAKKLLRESLSDQQRQDYDEYGHFYVEGNDSGQRYRINEGRMVNINVMDGEDIKYNLCAHVRDYVPDPDNMLAQKLMLENCEQQFLDIAVIH